MVKKDDGQALTLCQQEIALLRAENEQLKKSLASQKSDDKEFFALRDLIALMPGNIFWKDKNGKLLGCNNQLAKILSLTSPEEIIGKHTTDLVGSELAAQIDKIDKEIMVSTKPSIVEEIGFNEHHQEATYLSYKIPLRNKIGEVIGLLGTSLDITEHKKMEQELKIAKEKAEASNRAKSQFLAVMNHELRTPLTGILGLVNFLKQHDLTSNEKGNTLQDLENCTENLLSLVNDVLDFSRLEAGKYHLSKKSPTNLKQIITEVLSITLILAKNKGLELHTEWDAHLPEEILVDARILKQILINIINNAVKFTDHGHITLRLHVLQKTATKAKLEISIIDTGHGIPKDKLDFIFEPFGQLEDTYTRQSSRSGTGLGLAIVKRLIALLNLEISIQSKLGTGSIFTLTGKFDTPHTLSQENTCLAKVELANKQSLIPKLKALLIEDDKIVQRIHHKMLADLGCKVDIAEYGKEALQLLNGHHIVFVDIGLPDMNGFDVIRTIRQKHNRHIPIVALTGYTGDEEKSACLAAGANEIANKPISHDNMQKILSRYTKTQL